MDKQQPWPTQLDGFFFCAGCHSTGGYGEESVYRIAGPNTDQADFCDSCMNAVWAALSTLSLELNVYARYRLDENHVWTLASYGTNDGELITIRADLLDD